MVDSRQFHLVIPQISLILFRVVLIPELLVYHYVLWYIHSEDVNAISQFFPRREGVREPPGRVLLQCFEFSNRLHLYAFVLYKGYAFD